MSLEDAIYKLATEEEVEAVCANCGDIWREHYPLGHRMVCYNKDPNKMAIISETFWTPRPRSA